MYIKNKMSRFERPRDPHQTRNSIYVVAFICFSAIFCGLCDSFGKWVEEKNAQRYMEKCTYVCSVHPQPMDLITSEYTSECVNKCFRYFYPNYNHWSRARSKCRK